MKEALTRSIMEWRRRRSARRARERVRRDHRRRAQERDERASHGGVRFIVRVGGPDRVGERFREDWRGGRVDRRASDDDEDSRHVPAVPALAAAASNNVIVQGIIRDKGGFDVLMSLVSATRTPEELRHKSLWVLGMCVRTHAPSREDFFAADGAAASVCRSFIETRAEKRVRAPSRFSVISYTSRAFRTRYSRTKTRRKSARRRRRRRARRLLLRRRGGKVPRGSSRVPRARARGDARDDHDARERFHRRRRSSRRRGEERGRPAAADIATRARAKMKRENPATRATSFLSASRRGRRVFLLARSFVTAPHTRAHPRIRRLSKSKSTSRARRSVRNALENPNLRVARERAGETSPPPPTHHDSKTYANVAITSLLNSRATLSRDRSDAIARPDDGFRARPTVRASTGVLGPLDAVRHGQQSRGHRQERIHSLASAQTLRRVLKERRLLIRVPRARVEARRRPTTQRRRLDAGEIEVTRSSPVMALHVMRNPASSSSESTSPRQSVFLFPPHDTTRLDPSVVTSSCRHHASSRSRARYDRAIRIRCVRRDAWSTSDPVAVAFVRSFVRSFVRRRTVRSIARPRVRARGPRERSRREILVVVARVSIVVVVVVVVRSRAPARARVCVFVCTVCVEGRSV